MNKKIPIQIRIISYFYMVVGLFSVADVLLYISRDIPKLDLLTSFNPIDFFSPIPEGLPTFLYQLPDIVYEIYFTLLAVIILIVGYSILIRKKVIYFALVVFFSFISLQQLFKFLYSIRYSSSSGFFSVIYMIIPVVVLILLLSNRKYYFKND